MDNGILEHAAIEDIAKSMIDNFNTRISFRRKSRKSSSVSSSPDETLIKCVQWFMSLMQSLATTSFPLELCSACFYHKATSENTRGTKINIAQIKETVLCAFKSSHLVYAFTPKVLRQYKAFEEYGYPLKFELHIFERAESASEFAEKSKLRSVTFISPDESGTLNSTGKFTQFKRIFDISTLEPNPILNRFKDDYLEYMLNTQSPNVCKLLPYLLTSYVFNYKTNNLIERGEDNLSFAFEEDDVPIANASRIRKQLRLLCKRFHLSENISFHQNSPGKSEEDNLVAWMHEDSISPWNDVHLLWRVFVAWSGIFIYLNEAPSSSDSTSNTFYCTFPHPIDFEASFQLFSLRTGFVQTFSPDVSIAQHLANTFSDFFPDWPEILGADGQTGT